MRKGEAFPSNYLSKEDVAAGPIRGTIADVRFETIKGDRGDEDKPVMSFKEDGLKPMILNNTNWQTAEDAYGDESDGWRGKTIELYLDPGVMFGNKKVGGVRVRIPNGNPGPAAAPPAAAPATASAPPTMMLWELALSQGLEAGLNEEELKARLKDKGIKELHKSPEGPVVDAAAVKEIIQYQNDTIPY